uniref:Uncharacterized protein n=1 Tax=Panstrongylus lignarius TaxID=156445 RepID=A0A224Y4M8_9HEMI
MIIFSNFFGCSLFSWLNLSVIDDGEQGEPIILADFSDAHDRRNVELGSHFIAVLLISNSFKFVKLFKRFSCNINISLFEIFR